MEEGNPEIIGVGDLLLLVHTRQPEGQPPVVLHLFGIHHIHVERRIGHDEIALAPDGMDILVEGVRFPDVSFQTVDGEVHLGQPDGCGGLLLAVESDLVAGLLPLPLDEVAGLHEHAARAAGGVENDAVVRFDDIHDGLDQGRRSEELAAVLRPLHGELHEEVFVDAPEDIPFGAVQGFPVENTEEVFKHGALEDGVVFGQDSGKRFEALLDGGHGINERLPKLGIAGQSEEVVVAGLFGQIEGSSLLIIILDGIALGHLPGGHVLFNLFGGLVEAVGRMPKENQSEDRHAIFRGGQLGVGPQLVCCLPEIGFKPRKGCEVITVHRKFKPPLSSQVTNSLPATFYGFPPPPAIL